MEKKKILHIIPNLGSGGAEKLLVDLIKHMKMEGFICEVAILSNVNNFYLESLKILNVKMYISSEKNVYSFKNIFFLKRIFCQQEYDIVHTHLYAAQLYGAIANLLLKQKNLLITTEHSTHNRRRDIILFKPLDYIMYKNHKGIINITQETKDNLNRYLPSTVGKSIIIYNGVDLDLYSKAPQIDFKEIDPEFTSNTKIIMMVAAMRKEKDQETLIRATQYLPNDYKVVFVGGGYREKSVRTYAKEYKNVYFLGERNDVPQLLKSAHCFVLSSHGEGFGLVVIEARAAGLPVIASNVKGLANIVKSIGGQLFSAGNEKELANSILNIKKIDHIDQKLLEQYSINRTVNHYISYYKSLLQ